MKYYLSSYKIGDFGHELLKMADDRPLAYIPNALDHRPLDAQETNRQKNMKDLNDLGVAFELVDLKDFFSDPEKLSKELEHYSGIWITGGNTFVLRQAMYLSKFDQAILNLKSTPFLYSGFSAALCVLAPDLYGIQHVDDPGQLPYPQLKETIWSGLGILPYMILPHYKSNHPESADIDLDLAYCRIHGIPHRTISDGDVLYGEDIEALRQVSSATSSSLVGSSSSSRS